MNTYLDPEALQFWLQKVCQCMDEISRCSSRAQRLAATCEHYDMSMSTDALFDMIEGCADAAQESANGLRAIVSTISSASATRLKAASELAKPTTADNLA